MRTTVLKQKQTTLRIRLKSLAVCSLFALFISSVEWANAQAVTGEVTSVNKQSAVNSVLSEEAASASAEQANSENYFNEKGYRSQRYRAPLPDTVPGGNVVRSDHVREYIEQHRPLLIDVLSVTLRTEAIDFGISWLPDSPRQNIPGSVWLPNVGRADLEPFMIRFFSDHLVDMTDGDKAHPILFYCIADCWMSWNAVKRAAEWGYSNVYWFPEGTDGWVASGGELVETEPESIIDYIRDAEIQ